MKRRLSDIEADMRKEHRLAERFAEKEGVGSLPGRRLETGESAHQGQVGHHGNAEAPTGREEGMPRRHRDDVSYSIFDSMEQYEDWLLDTGMNYIPLTASGHPAPTIDQLEKRARMNHVLGKLTAKQVSLLQWRHVENMTLQEIANQEGVSKQAILKRLQVAEADFKAAFAEHWNDDILWEV